MSKTEITAVALALEAVEKAIEKARVARVEKTRKAAGELVWFGAEG